MNIDVYKDNIGKVLFALSLLIFGLMIFTPLNSVFIHADEFFTLFVVKFPVTDIINVNIHDVHPPLYYLIVKAIAKLLGVLNVSFSSLFLIKIISIISYGLILLFSALKLRDEYGWLSVGIFTFALGFLSQFFMHFILGRMYALGIVFLLLSFYFMRNILNDSDTRSWVFFTVFSVLGAYTHYFVAISSVVMYLMLLMYLILNKQSLKKWFISVLSGIVMYLPWIYALVKQLTKVHNSYWIKDLTVKSFIKCLGYFSTNSDAIIIQLIAIFALIFFIVVLIKNSDNILDSENYYILSGIGVFVGTLAVGSILSVVFKPILVARYLLPASAVLWFAVSILVGKIKNRRILLVSLALIMLLSVCAIADTVTSNDKMLEDGNNYNQLLIKINDGDIVIFNSGVGLLEFGDYVNDTDIYTVELNDPYGIPNSHVEGMYDFKQLNETGIKDLIAQNPDKKIYLVDAWGDEKFDDLNKTDAGKIVNVKFYEV